MDELERPNGADARERAFRGRSDGPMGQVASRHGNGSGTARAAATVLHGEPALMRVRGRDSGFHPRADADPRLSGRGHLYAKLDPLGTKSRVPSGTRLSTYGFDDAISTGEFIDNVLGMETATLRRS